MIKNTYFQLIFDVLDNYCLLVIVFFCFYQIVLHTSIVKYSYKSYLFK